MNIRQLKITFLDVLDYSEYFDTNISNFFFHENIASAVRQQYTFSVFGSKAQRRLVTTVFSSYTKYWENVNILWPTINFYSFRVRRNKNQHIIAHALIQDREYWLINNIAEKGRKATTSNACEISCQSEPENKRRKR